VLKLFERGEFLIQMMEGGFELLPATGMSGAFEVFQNPGA